MKSINDEQYLISKDNLTNIQLSRLAPGINDLINDDNINSNYRQHLLV